MDVISKSPRRTPMQRLLPALLLVATAVAGAAPPPPPPPPHPPSEADARNARIVVLIVDLAVDGTITGVRLEKSSGFPELDAAAVNAAAGWQLDPLQQDGKPVAGKARVPVSFPAE